MILIHGTIRLPPGTLDKAHGAMRAMIEASRAEPGCRHYSYSEDVLDPGLIHVNELWESRDALEEHFKAPHIGAWRMRWEELGISDRKLQSYEIGEPTVV